MSWKEEIDAFLEKGFDDDADIKFGTEVNPMQIINYLKSKGFEDCSEDLDKRYHIVELVKEGYVIVVWVSLWDYSVNICWDGEADE